MTATLFVQDLADQTSTCCDIFPDPLPVQDVNRAILEIQNLNLEPIQYKMMDEEEGEGWSKAKTFEIAFQYRNFLILKVLYPKKTISPTRDIDKMWHYHILDTSKYMLDCQNIFGNYLHHFPYLGMRGEKDRVALTVCFEDTKQLFLHHFGVEMGSDNDLVATSTCNTYCGGNIRFLSGLSRPQLS